VTVSVSRFLFFAILFAVPFERFSAALVFADFAERAKAARGVFNVFG
jgi:hypothetical protein